MKSRFLLVWIWVCLLAVTAVAADAPVNYPELKAEAERFYAEGSYARALELYQRAQSLSNLPPAEVRWIAFRLPDTQWRSQAATQTADNTLFEQARQQLETFVQQAIRDEGKDRLWAEAQESLGDFHWQHRQSWPPAWTHYQQALDWWAGAHEVELARERYLAIVWRMARPRAADPSRHYGSWGNYIPANILENTLKIAQSDTDKAYAHYLLAMTFRHRAADGEQRARVVEEFEAALRAGKENEWYDDALYNYAEWMLGNGRVIPLANGSWRSDPDYTKALALFRRLVTEFQKGQTRYYDSAEQQIKSITDPQLGIRVGNIFLPQSEIQYDLDWRNVKQVELAIYPVDLNRDVDLSADPERRWNWLESIDLSRLERIRSWTFTPTAADGSPAGEERAPDEYRPGRKSFRLEEKLPTGAYVIEARGGGRQARELILVTDAAIVLKASGKQALVYFCNALDSSPLGNAQVRIWERWHDGRRWQSRAQSATTREDGIALFELANRDRQHTELFASARSGDTQAFSSGNGYWYGHDHEPWKIYATTDRPAYRPSETVQWKFTARRYNGSVYSTPSDQTVEYEITDPRGTKVKSDVVTLNTFGSAWGSLETTGQLPLGEYQIVFWQGAGRTVQIGSATLFRLEEYKLPEFKVTVQTPEVEGKKKAFRLGEEVEVSIQADYYFGGPVANATVEVVVHQNPFWRLWPQQHEFPWLHDDAESSARMRPWRGGGGQIVKRESIRTDATGRARLTFETPRGAGQDYEYRIEARVTDASRREIIGNGTVRVTQQRYFVNARADHNLYRPQDRVRVEFRALDANDQPVETEGVVRVTRDYWYEIWVAPDGREVRGDELKRLQGQTKIWPPPPERPDQRDWRLKFRGYEHDEVLTRTVRVGTNGLGEFTFTPERDGYYRIAWTSEDAESRALSRIANPIKAETTVWVATTASTDLGYRSGGVEIIVDKDTFRVGQTAPIMLVAQSSDRYVLFSVEGEDLYSYQLVHLAGSVKLVELPIQEQHVPNMFLTATLVNDRQIFTDIKEVIVPPTKNFLTVEVTPDREQYEPQQEGTLRIATRNDQGEPVSAEVSLGLVDESVYYIQSDYAGDPRQFFFGTKRGQHVQTHSTMNEKRYARLIPWEGEQLIDERTKEALERQKRAGEDRMEGGMAGFGDQDAFFDGKVVTALPAVETAGARLARVPREAMMQLKEMPAQPASVPSDEPAVQVRTDFRSTVFWQPDVITDRQGQATVKVKYPDALTGWKATARAATRENQFGIADATTRTKLPLIVRLQAPRFFLVGDKVVISAIYNNNTDTDLTVVPSIEVEGLSNVSPLLEKRAAVNVPANGEVRVDWPMPVQKAGPVRIKVAGRSGAHADAMERSYISFEHGIEKFLAKSGKARGNNITVQLDLPRERKAGSTSLTVQVTPSMAVTMLDALPYLLEYPYGCTEQTMSRFLPAVITAKTLRDLGLEPANIMGRVFGGIETNTAAATHPRGQTHLDELDKLVNAGLDRLYDFQHSDGGWGWWKEGESDHWMSAYVVWGMSLARDAGVRIDEARLGRGKDYLDRELVEQENNPDMQAWMLHALAAYYAPFEDQLTSPHPEKAFENLWTKRDQLNAYTRALFALSAHYLGKTDRAKILVQNLENGAKRDARPDTSVLIQTGPSGPAPDTLQSTAHWGEDGIYWRWSDGGIEATAFALRALLAIDPQNALVEPVSNWLIKNRRGAQWSNTRDTAIVVLAMNDYLRASGELQTDLEFELLVNNRAIATRAIRGADVFNAPSRFTIDPELIRERNQVQIRSKGSGAVYFAVEAKFFSLEEPITPAGNEIFVKRDYFKLVGRPTLLKGYVYDRHPLRDGDQVKSGERVQTVITIEAKNNYEYLVFEDLKPAGLEAVAVRSGEPLYAQELKSGSVEQVLSQSGRRPVLSGSSIINHPSSADFTGRSRQVYQELRDRKVALFVDKLPEGIWQIRYDLRAEVPGEFHALPVLGHAMYVPEIRANSAEVRIQVTDASN